jgi:hypothetical protein
MLYSMSMLKSYKLMAKDILKKAIGHLEKVSLNLIKMYFFSHRRGFYKIGKI